MNFQRDDRVIHPQFGPGSVLSDEGETVVVRFSSSIQECRKSELTLAPSQGQDAVWAAPREVVARGLAYLIESINDSWGVFSRSRIELLPHQLWVCHRVLQSWPMRWMIADDVGLGKTIEAGLILWPLITKERVRRLLVLAPASLVEQWQYRLRAMFDVRVTRYVPELDTEKSDYWNTHPMVAASIHTLRDDREGRHARLLDSNAWDLVIVDEAHHLNNEEQSGATLAYRLLEKLESHGKLTSLLFFTGTPHRGKDYNFLALLRLLRPEVFRDPKRKLTHYLDHLPEVLIRNNKYSVTDLEGHRLFEPPTVETETYSYSEDEQVFYNSMTEFIATGKAYSSSLSQSDSRTAQLVLIALQKLASSSIAAVRRALRGRLERIRAGQRDLDALRREYERLRRDPDRTEDEEREIEEQLVELGTWVQLVADEPQWLERLLEAADHVERETKIEEILALVRTRFSNRSVLFFTEYKATQSLLLSRLASEFGMDQIAFINGDGRANDVLGRSLTMDRTDSAERFNEGKVRFLVSTEAAGEGVDLQRSCHTLIHVDLPWNPMRLHQRVGRLNRFGQKHRVDVVALRNPATVESRIWDKLNEKIGRIQQALVGTMDEPEDLMQLVLGMTSPEIFTELFSEGDRVPRESLSDWFDERTATFGGQDVIHTVNALVGHSAKFDFRSVAPQIPKFDLPDLKPFFRLMLSHNRRRPSDSEEGLSFLTPDAWRDSPAVLPRYENLVFDRTGETTAANERIIGIGHPLMTRALRQAIQLNASHAVVPKGALELPVLLFRFVNRVTTEEAAVSTVVRGVELTLDGPAALSDARAFGTLRGMTETALPADNGGHVPEGVLSRVTGTKTWVADHIDAFALPFDLAAVEFESAFWPEDQLDLLMTT